MYLIWRGSSSEKLGNTSLVPKYTAIDLIKRSEIINSDKSFYKSLIIFNFKKNSSFSIFRGGNFHKNG